MNHQLPAWLLNFKMNDTESDTPLYSQLLETMKQAIQSGSLKAGDPLPSESQLCKWLQVSRTTIRLAMDQLSEQGLIVRRRGRGSTVASPKLHRTLDHLYNFTEDMLVLQAVPESIVLESIIFSAGLTIGNMLNLPYDEQVLRLSRIRKANGEPILLEHTYLPMTKFPSLETVDFTSQSLYRLLRDEYHVQMGHATETYECVSLSKETAKLLQTAAGSPAFHVKRIAFTKSCIPFEYTESFARGDRCIFQAKLTSNQDSVDFKGAVRYHIE
ncbi:GntR family transcriptional regulator [Paenibacillus tianmuensis]|uniref:GntR family transcriptional regulator n=1 Tax=Paenibacillus tianmuensis TaxID=624147 RepID=A0A1G4S5J5_9BACL|nr:GntR family transcriptional regulator [Paenibacillus tianmuensis]SCW64434.1 GntR family transcriptional regulator [Paenibacillus tianmuensis]